MSVDSSAHLIISDKIHFDFYDHFRSAHTASVLSGLPNVMDYVYKNRMNLLEERRQYIAQRMQIAQIEGN